jgi:hypothetical protein
MGITKMFDLLGMTALVTGASVVTMADIEALAASM